MSVLLLLYVTGVVGAPAFANMVTVIVALVAVVIAAVVVAAWNSRERGADECDIAFDSAQNSSSTR